MNVTRVSVTARHIEAGICCAPGDCPLALAVTEALAAQGAGNARVTVSSHDAWIIMAADGGGYRRYRAPLDARARAFIGAFDDGFGGPEAVAPFETALTWQELPQ